jgi:hypothetical protein
MEHSTPSPAPTINKRKKTIIILVIIAGIALVGFFGFRTFRSIMRLRQMERMPLSTDVELIRGWMTLPYISDAYRVPPKVLIEACKLPPPVKDHESLSQINRTIAPNDPGSTVECIKKAVSAFQKSHPTPPAKPQ